jgi:hypothetical protein
MDDFLKTNTGSEIRSKWRWGIGTGEGQGAMCDSEVLVKNYANEYTRSSKRMLRMANK